MAAAMIEAASDDVSSWPEGSGSPSWFSKSASSSLDLCFAADLRTFSRCRIRRCRSSRSPLVIAVMAVRSPSLSFACLVYETRRKLLKRDVSEDEAHCRAYEWAVSVFRDNHRDASLEDAKAAVLAAIW